MHRNELCLDFRAKRVNIEANVGDDLRFSAAIKLDDEDVLADDYTVETFIFNEDGEDISETYNFEFDKFDGLIKFKIEDAVTTTMGPGNWTYAIVVTLLNESDYERSYINGNLVLSERSDVK